MTRTSRHESGKLDVDLSGGFRSRGWVFGCVVVGKRWHRSLVAVAALLLALSTATTLVGQEYSFIGESRVVDTCPACGRPDILVPIRGSFRLRWVEESPIEIRYAVEALEFCSVDGVYRGAGSGSFVIASVGPAVLQRWDLAVAIAHRGEVTDCLIRESAQGFSRGFPMIKVGLAQTNGTATLQFLLAFEAAPFAEMWFATGSGFTPGDGADYVPGGTVLSRSGGIVTALPALLQPFEPVSAGSRAQLDALDVAPGGITLFSVSEDVESKGLGTLHHGDLLTSTGQVQQRFDRLLAAFSIQPPIPDLGLDALHVDGSGEILFSVATGAFSERLGIVIGHGDLLSERGTVLRSNASLLQQFHPPRGDRDYGLDALWIWPHGEVWFSVEEGFNDDLLGHVGAGDVLSDQGYVIQRNLDLLAPFTPLEDIADFGLSALFLVAAREGAAQAEPAPALVQIGAVDGSLHLEWQGGGRVFQVEQAFSPAGPFQAIRAPDTARTFVDQGILETVPRAFYRVRQW